jgi:hypothetical protein
VGQSKRCLLGLSLRKNFGAAGKLSGLPKQLCL